MPQQLTLTTQFDAGFEAHRKTTRRDVFLAEMDKVVPWAELCAVIEPFYPKPRADGGGRPTVGLERMLRIHFLQQWYALSDSAVEEALYDSAAMHRFVGIDLGRESAPDETTVCKFRHLLLPGIVTAFLKAYPGIRVEVLVEDGFVDVLSVGCDAGIRYDERLEQDMIAVPIGPRVERFATAAAPDYLDAHGRPEHPHELLSHACLRVQFAGGATPTWKFERAGEVVELDPTGPLLVRPAAALDLSIDAAVAGVGVIHLFEELLRPHFESGVLEPILTPWRQSFSGPFLYYPGGRHVPAPLRAFVDFLKSGGVSPVAVARD
ncbi:LysR substrate-binding domain-containing protein [Pandoraea sp.]|uniref:LysR substrate-binding domain-containing protein n=1 Tax=Pandoraea sp. TaxID=1883445 RepID=UPI0011FEC405|nr:LysR substrate-binding domain-containing protein [Pandoraea sp.]TAL55835.1 MAG: hypothetical protein EPN80_05960 [Pandoraea sp.]